MTVPPSTRVPPFNNSLIVEGSTPEALSVVVQRILVSGETWDCPGIGSSGVITGGVASRAPEMVALREPDPKIVNW